MVFLGQASNYRGHHMWHHLFARGSQADVQRLRQALARRYQADFSQVQLYHTGRSALTATLQSLVSTGSPVIVPGLTCIAVIRAIKAAGCTPVYVDIDPKTLQYDFSALTAALKPFTLDKSNKKCYNGVIMAQNTLGLGLAMSKLQPLAAAAHFAIIEDLAHCAGRYYPDGREIGTVGAATVLSFGKGKSIDTIEGGAAIIRRPVYTTTTSKVHQITVPLVQPLAVPTKTPRRSEQLRDRWYPVFGWLARGLYHLGLGRLWLGVLHRLHWLARSADAVLNTDLTLPAWQAKLALEQLSQLPRTPLREHYFVRNRSAVLRALARAGYHLDEIWYDAPVSPVRYAEEAAFPTKTCPQTVWVSQHIVNLPTWYPESKLALARQIIQQHLIKEEERP